MVIPEARRMWGMELYLSECRLKDGEYLILVSAEFCEKPHEEYLKRWLSAKEHLPPWTRYLVPFSDQLRAF